MSLASMVQYALFLVVVVLLVRPVGIYLLRVFTGQKTMLDRVVRPVERLIYRLAGIDAERQMNGKQYAIAFLLFSLVGTLLLYAILRLQSTLPGAPNRAYLTTPMTPDLAFNTAVSFSTTTTWQAYGLPESDGRTHRTKLPCRRGGAGCRRRLHPRLCRASHGPPWEFLGRSCACDALGDASSVADR